MVVAFTGALSVAMFALPVSLLTWGFEAEALRCARKTSRNMKRNNTFDTQIDGASTSSMNSDEEYLKIIAKETDKSESAGVSEAIQRNVQELVERYLREDIGGKNSTVLMDFLMSNIPYREGDISLLERSESHFQNFDLSQRVMKLETAVDSINSKLDSILQMMEIRGKEIPILDGQGAGSSTRPISPPFFDSSIP
eukprot:CAMPEP_0178783416 /NCGR_PEP_ID=MMETSP0745-20121128/3674_1 /TAXON_ID=913974 /ORGANISM="Nitzschia punctata, Strain CCMP561" /LENGTH=195 /DNA_ID=CAMNT_0020440927 /DNA_START=186 /DNA_END=773 /DNA_ORIENTATION=-